MKDPGNPAKRLLRSVAKDATVESPPPSTPMDPRDHGATVRLVNPTTLEEHVFTLPAGAEWKGIGNPPGSTGYKYSSKTGPCRSLVIRQHSLIKVVCSGKAVPMDFSLDEASQGSLAVSIALGNSTAQCAVFGGLVKQDEPGKFRAIRSPESPGCP